MFDLNNKVAIVTGASKGIGEAIAKGLAKHGAKVVVSSRNQESIDRVSESINKTGGNSIAKACHVGDKNQLIELVETTSSVFGGVDILVNNAASNPVFGKLSETNEAAFEKIMNINLKACYILSNLCYPIMIERGGGSIINIASVEGIKPTYGLGLYSISKAALIMLTKSQATEWGRKGIRSNAICPGLIQTKFSQALWEDEKNLKKFVGHLPLQRMGQADEMTGLAIYLASDNSSYTTGGVFNADGGYLVA
jgi:NAD(P)-dependent dehydrogenase (short-subunit alcohol dehydrogenase family)